MTLPRELTLIERLRDMCMSAPELPSCKLCGEAADELERLGDSLVIAESNYSESVERHLKDVATIERLEAENSRLRETKHCDHFGKAKVIDNRLCCGKCGMPFAEALQGDDE